MDSFPPHPSPDPLEDLARNVRRLVRGSVVIGVLLLVAAAWSCSRVWSTSAAVEAELTAISAERKRFEDFRAERLADHADISQELKHLRSRSGIWDRDSKRLVDLYHPIFSQPRWRSYWDRYLSETEPKKP